MSDIRRIIIFKVREDSVWSSSSSSLLYTVVEQNYCRPISVAMIYTRGSVSGADLIKSARYLFICEHIGAPIVVATLIVDSVIFLHLRYTRSEY